MQRSISIAIASTAAKRSVHQNLQEKGNPSSFNLYGICCLERAFSSGTSGDYREILRDGLRDIKLDDAIDLFSQMVKSRPFPSIVDFSKLLSAIAKMKKYDVVISLGEQMQNLGIPHNLYTYSIFINCFCRSSQLPFALAILGKMMKLGYEPSIVISGFCRKSLKEEADDLFRKMKEDGPVPNSGTYNTLIRARLRDNDKAASAEFIKEMRSCGFTGDASTISLVTNMLYDGRLDKSFLDMLS